MVAPSEAAGEWLAHKDSKFAPEWPSFNVNGVRKVRDQGTAAWRRSALGMGIAMGL